MEAVKSIQNGESDSDSNGNCSSDNGSAATTQERDDDSMATEKKLPATVTATVQRSNEAG